MSEAIALLQRSLAIDPSYAPAAALVGWCRIFETAEGWGPATDAEIAEAVRLAKQAIDIGKDDPDTISAAGITLGFFADEPATATSVIDRALALTPIPLMPGWRAGSCRPTRTDRARRSRHSNARSG